MAILAWSHIRPHAAFLAAGCGAGAIPVAPVALDATGARETAVFKDVELGEGRGFETHPAHQQNNHFRTILRTHLRGARIAPRSKTPELVEREFRGLLTSHHAIRCVMHQAALKTDEIPDRFCFLQSVGVAQRRMARYAAIPPSAEDSLA